jgi:catechol 2,3-dioxygenase-like lactoylglutathione lyase family enzyme
MGHLVIIALGSQCPVVICSGWASGQTGAMLTDGINHVAVLTSDTDRLIAFYTDVFEAVAEHSQQIHEGMRLSLIRLGERSELNVFELTGNEEPTRQTPMFGRGRLDHLGLQAASLDAFDEIRRRLVECGASDGFVTDFGNVFSLFFVDPDGLEAEVCVESPGWVPGGALNPPGTPAARYHSS